MVEYTVGPGRASTTDILQTVSEVKLLSKLDGYTHRMLLFSSLTGEAFLTVGNSQSRHSYLVTVLRPWATRFLALNGTSVGCAVTPKEHCGREGRRNIRMGDRKDKYGTLSSVHGHSNYEHAAVVATSVRPMPEIKR